MFHDYNSFKATISLNEVKLLANWLSNTLKCNLTQLTDKYKIFIFCTFFCQSFNQYLLFCKIK